MADYKNDVKRILKELERQGFRIRDGKHWVIYPPDRTKRVMAFPKSPSDWRGMKNLLRDLKSVGYVPPQGGGDKIYERKCLPAMRV